MAIVFGVSRALFSMRYVFHLRGLVSVRYERPRTYETMSVRAKTRGGEKKNRRGYELYREDG